MAGDPRRGRFDVVNTYHAVIMAHATHPNQARRIVIVGGGGGLVLSTRLGRTLGRVASARPRPRIWLH